MQTRILLLIGLAFVGEGSRLFKQDSLPDEHDDAQALDSQRSALPSTKVRLRKLRLRLQESRLRLRSRLRSYARSFFKVSKPRTRSRLRSVATKTRSRLRSIASMLGKSRKAATFSLGPVRDVSGARASALKPLVSQRLPPCLRAREVVLQDSAVHHLTTEEEFKEKIAEEHDDIIIVKFYSKKCRSCKAMGPKFERLARSWPELEFCEIQYEENEQFIQSLGVEKVPYVVVYSCKEGQLYAQTLGPSHVAEFQAWLQSYLPQWWHRLPAVVKKRFH